MQLAAHRPAEDHRRPSGLDLTAALLLLASVVLHVVAMFPNYFEGAGGAKSLISQPDQAALYAVLAASWALALAIGLSGPARTPVAAGLAVGIAATELGFRLSDLGYVFRYGLSTAGPGLWLMLAAWVVGAAGAAVAVLAVRSRHGNIVTGPWPAPSLSAASPEPESTALRSVWDIDWAAPARPGAAAAASAGFLEAPSPSGGFEAPSPSSAFEAPSPSGAFEAPSPTGAIEAVPTGAIEAVPTGAIEATDGGIPAVPRGGDTGVLPTVEDDPHAAQERTAWTMLIVVLSLLVAGAFLPSWDRYVGVSTVTGRAVSFSLGNAFSGPWQVVIGTVLAAVAMAVVPIVAVRLRHRAVGAALTCGSLLVLAGQLVSAIVQVDQPVSPSVAGLSQSQASQLGLQLSMKLTGWFTVDAIAAYALFAAIMVWATLRVVAHENSTGAAPSPPAWRGDAIPWRP